MLCTRELFAETEGFICAIQDAETDNERAVLQVLHLNLLRLSSSNNIVQQSMVLAGDLNGFSR